MLSRENEKEIVFTISLMRWCCWTNMEMMKTLYGGIKEDNDED